MSEFDLFAQQVNGSILAGWAEVLDVEEADVPLYLGDVASLLRDVRDAARETGSDAFGRIPDHLSNLSQTIFPVGEPFRAQASAVRPEVTAMEAIRMLSAYLERLAPEGRIPDEGEQDELRESLRARRRGCLAKGPLKDRLLLSGLIGVRGGCWRQALTRLLRTLPELG